LPRGAAYDEGPPARFERGAPGRTRELPLR
jgi:hypothetical protein